MNTEFLKISQQNLNIFIMVVVLVIFGIVSFNAYSVWYITAQNNIQLGVGLGGSVGLDVPSYLRRREINK